MTKTKILSMLVLSIALLATVGSVSAYAPVYPEDDAETVERVNQFNQNQTESAKERYKGRVFGETDQTKTPEEREAYRQQMLQQKQDRLNVIKAEKEAKLGEKVENRCELVEAKINNRLNNYETKRDKHVSRYNHIKEKLTDLLVKLENRGCDVTAVRDNMTELDTLIEEFAAAYRAMASDLEGTRSLACGESDGEFVTAVKQAKNHIPTIHTKAQAVHTYISNTLRPQIQRVAQTCEEVEE